MAKRHIYDEPNPFSADIRESRVPSKKAFNVIQSTSSKSKPTFQRFFTKKFLNVLLFILG